MKISAQCLAKMKQQNLICVANMAFYSRVGQPAYAFDYFAVWCKNNQWFQQLETGQSDGWQLEKSGNSGRSGSLEVTSQLAQTWNRGKQ